jgi:hypothetical protein
MLDLKFRYVIMTSLWGDLVAASYHIQSQNFCQSLGMAQKRDAQSAGIVHAEVVDLTTEEEAFKNVPATQSPAPAPAKDDDMVVCAETSSSSSSDDEPPCKKPAVASKKLRKDIIALVGSADSYKAELINRWIGRELFPVDQPPKCSVVVRHWDREVTRIDQLLCNWIYNKLGDATGAPNFSCPALIRRQNT